MHPDTIAELARSHRTDLDREAARRSLVAEARAARYAAEDPTEGTSPRRGGIGAGPVDHGLSIVGMVLRMRRLVRLRA